MNQSTLHELLNYDPVTGVFTWKKPRRSCTSGSKAGHLSKSGYYVIRINRVLYLGHRVAWVYIYGSIPEGSVIDHLDGDGSNNAISNLRIGTQGQNMQNFRTPNATSTTGFLGVSFDKQKQMYVAQIKLSGKRIRVGFYHTPEAAHQAYLEKKRQIHSFCTI